MPKGSCPACNQNVPCPNPQQQAKCEPIEEVEDILVISNGEASRDNLEEKRCYVRDVNRTSKGKHMCLDANISFTYEN